MEKKDINENAEILSEDNGTKPVGEYEFSFSYSGFSLKLWSCLLIAVLCALINILTTSTINDNRTSTVFIVFISILIIMVAVYHYGIYGVISAALSSLLFCLTSRVSWLELIINVAANTFQALVIWLAFKTNTDETLAKKRGTITDHKLILIIIGLLYIIFSFVFNRSLMLFIFMGLVLFFTALSCIKEKSLVNLKFFILFCVLPSLTGALINASGEFINGDQSLLSWLDNVKVWAMSNCILFGTLGYCLLCGIVSKENLPLKSQKDKIRFSDKVQIKLSTILYYISTLFWNLLFYIMYIVGWLDQNTPLYLFPWAVGNLFFLLNLKFTQTKEIGTNNVTIQEAFKWFENRAVVVERNTQMLITVISFLLPLCASFLGTISAAVSFVFVLNITTAIVCIGLIWVPQNNVHTMELVKNVKTIFHLFTLALLLLNAVLIIPIGV